MPDFDYPAFLAARLDEMEHAFSIQDLCRPFADHDDYPGDTE